ncbi:M13 family metallopeptidase [Undibacterium sp.]|uniref:M13 family metallopeptidase n=1 Tax=Undibacterium sp. TaxID=1914977 RepID=UPI003752AA84
MRYLTLLASISLAFSAQIALASDGSASKQNQVRYQDNFYQAANADWLANTKIPEDKSYAFGSDLPVITNQRIRTIVDELVKKQASGVKLNATQTKVTRYFQSYMDVSQIEKKGIAPIQAILKKIDDLQDMAAIARFQGELQGRIETPIFVPFVMPGFQDPGTNLAILSQGGLGLPDRDFYITNNAKNAAILRGYRDYLLKLASLAGESHPAKLADAALSIETHIAQAQWEPARSHDPALVASMSVSQLEKDAPDFDWQAFFQGAQLVNQDMFTNAQPGAVAAIAKLYGSVPLADWKAYFKLKSLHEATPVLPKAFRDASFAFFGQTLNGTPKEAARDKKAISVLNTAFGEALGRLYVERYFPEEQKKRMQTMVSHLLAAYRDSIQELSWMSDPTKKEALDKISKYGSKIGYPDVWRDYSTLDIVVGDALENRHRAVKFNWLQNAAKAGKKADRRDWDMLPQTVNAQYNPLRNDIEFPAAHLQEPYFSMRADDATNYGAIGATIGHEISHGFDNMGSQFDGDGRLRNWWTDSDRETFNKMAQKLVAQYNAYELFPGQHVDGELTLSENMADLSGLQIAFKAYKKSLHGKPSPVVNGLTGEQRFFLSYAQSRRSKTRPEVATQELRTSRHAPDVFRINGSLINVDGFHQAFGSKEGDAMYKPESQRVRIW